jgi:hypothetical protein
LGYHKYQAAGRNNIGYTGQFAAFKINVNGKQIDGPTVQLALLTYLQSNLACSCQYYLKEPALLLIGENSLEYL